MLVSLPTYTLIHVFLSLIGVFAGLVVVGGLMAGVRFDRWIAFFFAATVLTNVTGFGFPFVKVLPRTSSARCRWSCSRSRSRRSTGSASTVPGARSSWSSRCSASG